MNKNTNSRLKSYLCKHSLKKTGQFCTLLFCMSVLPSIVNADFSPILISDDNDHLIYKITGASGFADLTGENLNDGIAPDIEQVGSYPQGYNIQDLAKDSAGKTWALAAGTGADGTTLGHAYIGEITESSGSYSYTSIVDLGYTYTDAQHKNHGKGLVWDPDNQYFIYEANPTQSDSLKASFKAYDPVTGAIVSDPWGTGNDTMVIALPVAQTDTYAQGLSFSPEGDLYASIGHSPAFILKLERNASHKLTGNSTMIGSAGLGMSIRNIEVLSFSPDGELIIVASNSDTAANKGKVFKVDLTTGTPVEIADLDNGFGRKRDWEGIVFNNPVFEGNSCSLESFPGPLSTTQDEIRLTGNVQIHGTTTNALITQNLAENGFWGGSRCDGGTCVQSNTQADTIDINYLAGDSSDGSLTGGSVTISGDKNYSSINFISNSALTINDSSIIKIAGDFEIGSSSTLTINGEVTIYANNFRINNGGSLIINGSLKVVTNAAFNFISGGTITTNNPKKFVVFSKGNLHLNASSEFKGIFYSASEANVYSHSSVTGAVTARKIIVNHDTTINYDEIAVQEYCSISPTPDLVGISGSVFQDDNTNDTHDGIEAGLPNIAVSLYEDINNDDAIDNADNLIGIASSDNNGDYSFDSLSNGDYLVQVDSTDSSLASGLALGGTNPLDVTINGSNVADKDFPFDLSGCSALSGSINTGLISDLQISNGSKVFLGSTTVATEAGHLKAFVVNASGTLATEASWDAAGEMTPAERNVRLYSSDTNGDIIQFASLDDGAFATNGLPTVTTIKDTIKTATLGALSNNSNLALIDNSRSVFSYLSDAAYRSFITSTNTSRANRTKRVLASSDDGFLYAFNQVDGDLGWAWMPRSLVEGLKYPATFNDFHYMQGEIDVLDLKASDSYRSYVVGSYKQGLGQYVLRLSNDTASNLDAAIWDVDHSATQVSVPNNGKRAYFKDGNETTYAAYVTSGASANSSTLYIRSLTSTTTRSIPLTFNATSTAYVMTDVGSTTAKSIYLGDDVGNVYSASLLDVNQVLKSAADIQSDINETVIAALNTSDTSAVLFIGSAKSSTDNTVHLRAQSEDRLTIFKYDSHSGWIRQWTTYTGGSNKWSSDGSVVTDSNIQTLPANSKITDNAYIVANSLVLPITLEPANNQCDGLSYFYLYQLNDGHFPSNRFYTTSNTAISNTIALGKGNAKTLHFINLLGSSKMMGVGLADQTTGGTTGVSTQFIIKDPISTGVRSWKEL